MDGHGHKNTPSISLIFLVGFMGSGKSTTGKLLAKRIGYSFLDLDNLIEKRTGRKIRNIFAAEGEEYFRDIESETLQSCRGLAHTVVALGGGAFIKSANRDFCREVGKTIWLRCPIGICLARAARDRSRPLLGAREEMERLLTSRISSYEAADFTVDSSPSEQNTIVNEILRVLADGNSSRDD